mmetsp:Transcript_26618/g.40787  ORF Transcript_26618/g.40787 Transcript_26618/m.40787 type:complete len:86 (-) Transcript_26618:629-886(-)
MVDIQNVFEGHGYRIFVEGHHLYVGTVCMSTCMSTTVLIFQSTFVFQVPTHNMPSHVYVQERGSIMNCTDGMDETPSPCSKTIFH